MFNNVIDHSASEGASVLVQKNALQTFIVVQDLGIGIFRKLQDHFHLSDPRHALLELCKGKLTSDPSSHTGEGIFFTSRMFDSYGLSSGNLFFTRTMQEGRDWLIEVEEQEPSTGTIVEMRIRNDSTLTAKEVFGTFSPESGEYGFYRTIVPVRLALYEGEKLISRSQAKRLVARFDKFQEVILDFNGVSEIGQAFADEIFRVYQRDHPMIYLWNASSSILQLIQRVQGGLLRSLRWTIGQRWPPRCQLNHRPPSGRTSAGWRACHLVMKAKAPSRLSRVGGSGRAHRRPEGAAGPGSSNNERQTVRQYLTSWLETMRSSRKPRTQVRYAELIRAAGG